MKTRRPALSSVQQQKTVSGKELSALMKQKEIFIKGSRK